MRTYFYFNKNFIFDVGLIKVNYSVGKNDSDLVVGYADNCAYELSFIRLIKGHMPIDQGEAAITQSASESNELIESIFYYFNLTNYLYAICIETVVLILALIPSPISLYKTKNNILGH